MSDDAGEVRWANWVTEHTRVYLASKGYSYQGVLPQALRSWLLDHDRWHEAGYGDAWGSEEGPRGREFVIRSLEEWPDDAMLAALGRLRRTTKAVGTASAEQNSAIDLLAWWIVMDRGLVPTRLDQRMRPSVYDGLDTTRVGRAVYRGLRKKHLAYKFGPITPIAGEAYRRIFDFCFFETLDWLHNNQRKVVEKSESYTPQRGEAWGYLHRCIEHHIDDLLALQDAEVAVPTINMEDRFRKLLKAAYAQLDLGGDNPAGDDELSATERLDAIAYGCSEGAPRDEDESDLDGDETALLMGKQEILASAPPCARAVLLLCYTSPTTWDRTAITALARDLGIQKDRRRDFKALIESRSDRLQLAILRVETCREKHEYLRTLTRKTRRSLLAALLSEGYCQDEAEERIRLLEQQVSDSKLSLGELGRAQKRYPLDSQFYLAARLQELIVRENKMRRYIDRYSEEREKQYRLEAAEIVSLAGVFGMPPEQLEQAWAELRFGLGLP